MVPGIDLAGTVRESSHADWKAGDKVVLNGWGVGEVHWGGLAQVARLNGDWLVPLPSAFDERQAMAIGTAGYTAALCVDALVDAGVTPEQGPVLVTGATGGVGSVAMALLKAAGFRSRRDRPARPSEADYLKGLGADKVIDRATMSEKGKPLQREVWAGVVDTAGSFTLANACAQTKYGGAVAACGLAQGFDLPATVMPFILRGVRLLGVDSVMAPQGSAPEGMGAAGARSRSGQLEAIGTQIGLGEAVRLAGKFMRGEVTGRFIVNVNG